MLPLHIRFTFLFTILFTSPIFTFAFLLPYQVRPTSTSDLIGFYAIHPETDIAARPNNCPNNLTTDTFEFQVTRAPSFLPVPKLFNIQIDHRNTLVSGRRCESTGTIIATTSTHPFTAGNASDIITTWSAAGRGTPARWISKQFAQIVAKQSFAVGYDFSERTCRGIRLKPGIAFLWLQPVLDLQLGIPGSSALTLSTRNKYLIVTFANDPWSGCVFVAGTVGGQGDFPPGPVSDPSLDEEQEPDTLPSKETDTPTSNTTDTDDTSSEAEEGASPEPDVSEETATASESPDVDDDDDDDDDDESDNDLPPPPNEDTDDERPGPEDVDSIFSSGSDDPVEEPACFPASAWVELEDGHILQLANLKLGHKVRISQSRFSDIFFFSHRQIQQGTLHDFIKITITNTHHLTLSPGHYLYVNHALTPARNVRIGDKLYSAEGSELKVRRVQKVKEEGLIAPHTLHGDIAVNGIHVSTYTAAVHPHLAHYVLLAPVRAFYRLGFPGVFSGALDFGADRLRRMIPRGPERMNRFL